MILFTYSIIDYHLFYDGAVDIQIWALLTRSQCKVSDTQVTGKAWWPLVYSQNGVLKIGWKISSDSWVLAVVHLSIFLSAACKLYAFSISSSELFDQFQPILVQYNIFFGKGYLLLVFFSNREKIDIVI